MTDRPFRYRRSYRLPPFAAALIATAVVGAWASLDPFGLWYLAPLIGLATIGGLGFWCFCLGDLDD